MLSLKDLKWPRRKPLVTPSGVSRPEAAATVITCDLCVYGATPAGIMAAVAAARGGLSVLLVEPTGHLGGLLTSGLNATDAPVPGVIKGLAREFFTRCSARYGQAEMTLRHEPHVCGAVMRAMLDEAKVRVLQDTVIVMLRKRGAVIAEARTADRQRIVAQAWVDATYEGDLMPLAQVSFRLGREAREEYDEPLAGLQGGSPMFHGLDPVVPYSGGRLYDHVEEFDGRKTGSADWRVQASSFRLTLTSDPKNMRPIAAPEGYDPARHELFRQLIAADRTGRGLVNTSGSESVRNGYLHLAHLPNRKIDLNSGHLAPFNNPFLTQGWVAAGPAGRAQILQEFRAYTEGVLWFLRQDESVPPEIRAEIGKYWYPLDEYADGFPPALYVREGRRLVGARVITVHDLQVETSDLSRALGRGAYHLDCKPVRWFASRDGRNILREGQFFSSKVLKFVLPYDLILPQRHEASNLLVVTALSASHVAFGSLRMEPTWMLLGGCAGVAIALSVETGAPLHDIAPSRINRLHAGLNGKASLRETAAV